MEDEKIVDLYWSRSEEAISETDRKYGRYCRSIAYRILQNEADSEECVNDAYLQAWRSMPSQRPSRLDAFLGKITRNLSLNRWEKSQAGKRGSGQVPLVLDELRECASGVGEMADDVAFADLLNRFLRSLPREKRILFLRRYWYCCSIQEIASDFGISESKVKMTLLRTRRAFQQFLEKEEIGI